MVDEGSPPPPEAPPSFEGIVKKGSSGFRVDTGEEIEYVPRKSRRLLDSPQPGDRVRCEKNLTTGDWEVVKILAKKNP